jgi:hypothetical protein
MQYGECTGLERDRRDGGVLDLNPLVPKQSGVRTDLGRPPHQPQQQINRVYRLVHYGTAAVELPSAAPGAGVVVRLTAPPADRANC